MNEGIKLVDECLDFLNNIPVKQPVIFEIEELKPVDIESYILKPVENKPVNVVKYDKDIMKLTQNEMRLKLKIDNMKYELSMISDEKDDMINEKNDMFNKYKINKLLNDF